MAIDFKKIADEAAEKTDKQFAATIAELTSFKTDEVIKIISKSGISRSNFGELIDVVKDKAMDNEQKAEAIKKINKGMSVIISIVDKLL